ncbi:MAG: DUF2845 domain-containing protein [Gammaproteobacteria bacterium]|nr:DUF2845 domain-containing protein [Gammaproteobacteria bacterium]MCH9743959.1 DUF2845 domain-containing protein [Gammaproteobacteria bacterium]
MKNILKITLAAALLISSAAHAMMQCPGSTGFVALGDSIDKVIKACGQPQKRIDQKPAKDVTKIWQYKLTGKNTAVTQAVWLTFNNNKLTQIAMNRGVTVMSRQLACQGGTVILGNSMATVKQVCGEPLLIRSIQDFRPGIAQQQAPQDKIVNLIYKPNSYTPAKTFTFKGGQLVAIQ